MNVIDLTTLGLLTNIHTVLLGGWTAFSGRVLITHCLQKFLGQERVPISVKDIV